MSLTTDDTDSTDRENNSL